MLICAEFCGAALVGVASRRDFLWARHAFLPKERTSAGSERQRLVVPPDLLGVATSCVGGYGWRSVTNLGSEVKLIKTESSILSKHSSEITLRSLITISKTCHGVCLGVAVFVR